MKNPVVSEIATEPMHFRATVIFGDNRVTGLMGIRQKEDLSICGSFINEFGVKGFDFIYSNGKMNLVYIMPALDRMMVKKILKKDLSMLVKYGISDLGMIRESESSASPKILYPNLNNPKHNMKAVTISGYKTNLKTNLTLKDQKYKLTIELVSMLPDEE